MSDRTGHLVMHLATCVYVLFSVFLMVLNFATKDYRWLLPACIGEYYSIRLLMLGWRPWTTELK